MPRTIPRLFIIRCRNKDKPVIGENLQSLLRDRIESCDYKLMNDYKIDWKLLQDIKEEIDFTIRNKKEIEKYVSYYLVITTKQNIVLGFIRI